MNNLKYQPKEGERERESQKKSKTFLGYGVGIMEKVCHPQRDEMMILSSVRKGGENKKNQKLGWGNKLLR